MNCLIVNLQKENNIKTSDLPHNAHSTHVCHSSKGFKLQTLYYQYCSQKHYFFYLFMHLLNYTHLTITILLHGYSIISNCFSWISSYYRFGVQTVLAHVISGHIYLKKQKNIFMKIESKSPRNISVYQDGHHQVHGFCNSKGGKPQLIIFTKHLALDK